MPSASNRTTGGGHAAIAAPPTGLVATDVRVHFDGVKAVDGVDILLGGGEIVGLIGPNGAGKTTLLNALSGFQRPTGGRVVLDDEDVTGMDASRLVGRGICRTFQSSRYFSGMSVAENIIVAGLASGLRRRAAHAQVSELLNLVGIGTVGERPAGELSHGESRRLDIARALATRPRYLLLDEPAAGLDENEGRSLVDVIRNVRATRGCGVLLVEHDMQVVMSLCERLVVVDHGRVIASGSPAEVRRDPDVIAAYLGTHAEEAGHA